MIGQGVIVDDDGLGFDALRAKGYLPFDIDMDAFMITRTGLGYTQATNEKMQGFLQSEPTGHIRTIIISELLLR